MLPRVPHRVHELAEEFLDLTQLFNRSIGYSGKFYDDETIKSVSIEGFLTGLNLGSDFVPFGPGSVLYPITLFVFSGIAFDSDCGVLSPPVLLMDWSIAFRNCRTIFLPLGGVRVTPAIDQFVQLTRPIFHCCMEIFYTDVSVVSLELLLLNFLITNIWTTVAVKLHLKDFDFTIFYWPIAYMYPKFFTQSFIRSRSVLLNDF